MKMKKFISFLCAAALTVSSFAGLTVTASAAAADTVAITPTVGSKTVTVKQEGTTVTQGVLLHAVYTNGALTSVESQNIPATDLADANLTYNKAAYAAYVDSAKTGSKFLAWNSLEGMEPITVNIVEPPAPKTAVNTVAELAVTATNNSKAPATITAAVTAKNGQTFTDTAAFTYAWTKDGEDANTTGATIENAAAGTYTVTATYNGTGDYEGSLGPASITITAADETRTNLSGATVALDKQTATVGDTVTATVTIGNENTNITDLADLTYQWYKAGETPTAVQGATAKTYTTTEAGTFYVTVSAAQASTTYVGTNNSGNVVVSEPVQAEPYVTFADGKIQAVSLKADGGADKTYLQLKSEAVTSYTNTGGDEGVYSDFENPVVYKEDSLYAAYMKLDNGKLTKQNDGATVTVAKVDASSLDLTNKRVTLGFDAQCNVNGKNSGLSLVQIQPETAIDLSTLTYTALSAMSAANIKTDIPNVANTKVTNSVDITSSITAAEGNVAYYAIVTNTGREQVISNLTITTTPLYNVTIDSNITGGTVVSDKATAVEGETVTLTVTPNDGKDLQADSLKVNNGAVTLTPSGSKYTFVMPAGEATVTAAFVDSAVASYAVNLSGVPGYAQVYTSTDGETYTTKPVARTNHLGQIIQRGDGTTAPETVEATNVLVERQTDQTALYYKITKSGYPDKTGSVTPDGAAVTIDASSMKPTNGSYYYEDADWNMTTSTTAQSAFGEWFTRAASITAVNENSKTATFNTANIPATEAYQFTFTTASGSLTAGKTTAYTFKAGDKVIATVKVSEDSGVTLNKDNWIFKPIIGIGADTEGTKQDVDTAFGPLTITVKPTGTDNVIVKVGTNAEVKGTVENPGMITSVTKSGDYHNRLDFKNFYVAKYTDSTPTKTEIGGTVAVKKGSDAVQAAYVNDTLTADVTGVTPLGATVSYQWQKQQGTGLGSNELQWVNQTDATAATFTPTAAGLYRVVVTGTGNYEGTVESAAVTVSNIPVTPASVSATAKATIHDTSTSGAIADDDLATSYTIDNTAEVANNIKTIKVIAKDLKQHKNEGNTAGYWAGVKFTLANATNDTPVYWYSSATAPADAEALKAATTAKTFGAEKDADSETDISLYTDASRYVCGDRKGQKLYFYVEGDSVIYALDFSETTFVIGGRVKIVHAVNGEDVETMSAEIGETIYVKLDDIIPSGPNTTYTYQWQKQKTSEGEVEYEPVPNATSNSFTPTEKGTYRVLVTGQPALGYSGTLQSSVFVSGFTAEITADKSMIQDVQLKKNNEGELINAMGDNTFIFPDLDNTATYSIVVTYKLGYESADATTPTITSANKKVTLNAKLKEYTVQYDLGMHGDENDTPADATYTYNGAFTPASAPTADGYNFLGWYTGLTDGTKIENADGLKALITKDTTTIKLYAHWGSKSRITWNDDDVNGFTAKLNADPVNEQPGTAIVSGGSFDPGDTITLTPDGIENYEMITNITQTGAANVVYNSDGSAVITAGNDGISITAITIEKRFPIVFQIPSADSGATMTKQVNGENVERVAKGETVTLTFALTDSTKAITDVNVNYIRTEDGGSYTKSATKVSENVYTYKVPTDAETAADDHVIGPITVSIVLKTKLTGVSIDGLVKEDPATAMVADKLTAVPEVPEDQEKYITYQWYVRDMGAENWTAIEGATSRTYTVGDYSVKYIKVEATAGGGGNYTGTVSSEQAYVEPNEHYVNITTPEADSGIDSITLVSGTHLEDQTQQGSSSVPLANKGDKVTIKVTPKANYTVAIVTVKPKNSDGVYVTPEGEAEGNSGMLYSFIMPGDAVDISAQGATVTSDPPNKVEITGGPTVAYTNGSPSEEEFQTLLYKDDVISNYDKVKYQWSVYTSYDKESHLATETNKSRIDENNKLVVDPNETAETLYVVVHVVDTENNTSTGSDPFTVQVNKQYVEKEFQFFRTDENYIRSGYVVATPGADNPFQLQALSDFKFVDNAKVQGALSDVGVVKLALDPNKKYTFTLYADSSKEKTIYTTTTDSIYFDPDGAGSNTTVKITVPDAYDKTALNGVDVNPSGAIVGDTIGLYYPINDDEYLVPSFSIALPGVDQPVTVEATTVDERYYATYTIPEGGINAIRPVKTLKHTITDATTDAEKAHGTVEFRPTGKILTGTDVTVTVTPNTGYEKHQLEFTKADGSSAEIVTVTEGATDPETGVYTYTFKMPDYDIKATANFKLKVYQAQSFVTGTGYTGGLITDFGAGEGVQTDRKSASEGTSYAVNYGSVVQYYISATDEYEITKVVFNGTTYAKEPAEGEANLSEVKSGDNYIFELGVTGNVTRPTVTAEKKTQYIFDDTLEHGSISFTVDGEAPMTVDVNGKQAFLAKVGQTIVATINPAEHYEFVMLRKMLGTGSAGAPDITSEVTGGTYTFIMPNEAVTLQATFKAMTYNIGAVQSSDKYSGTLTVNGQTSGVDEEKTAEYNSTVRYTIKPKANYEITKVVIGDTTYTENPNTEAKEEALPAYNSETGYTFDVTVTGDIPSPVVTAVKTRYTIGKNVSGTGAITITVGGETVNKASAGDTVRVAYAPDGDKIELTALSLHHLATQSPEYENLGSGNFFRKVENVDAYEFTMPEEAVELTATFANPTHKLVIPASIAPYDSSYGFSLAGGTYQVYIDNEAQTEAGEKTVGWGKKIGIIGVNPVAGKYELESVTYTTGDVTTTVEKVDDKYEFTMPNADTTIAVNFIPTITKNAPENGTYAVQVNNEDATAAKQGETVTIIPNAAEGYRVDTVSVAYEGEGNPITPVEGTGEDAGKYTFTMPNKPVTVSVTFVSTAPATYAITNSNADADANGNKLTIDKATAEAEGNVVITPTIAEGYQLKSLTVKQGEVVKYALTAAEADGETPAIAALTQGTDASNNTTYTFSMPSGNVTVEAEFERTPALHSYVMSATSDEQNINVPIFVFK